MEFDINGALKRYLSGPATIPTPEAEASLVECEIDPDALTPQLVDRVLDSIVDAVAESPGAISNGSSFDSLQFLLKCAPTSLIPEQHDRSEPD